jgi:AmmeMemoRadiSam system protein B
VSEGREIACSLWLAPPNRASPTCARSRRVFLLGPSHHFYSKQCLLSPADQYATPLGAPPLAAG